MYQLLAMPKQLADYLREGEIITHTCYGTTYRATYRDGHLVDEIDPGLVFVSPTAFANSHLERGKANGWDKCKVERNGVGLWLKSLPKIEPVGTDGVPVKKTLRLRTLDDIKRALGEKVMPTKSAPVAAPAPTTKKKAPAAKKPAAAAASHPTSKSNVVIPPPEPSVICAKVVEGTDGLMDVCVTQLMILDYFKYEGVLYYKEATTQEVFEICSDKSIGACIGVWDSESAVLQAPYVETSRGSDEYEYE